MCIFFCFLKAITIFLITITCAKMLFKVFGLKCYPILMVWSDLPDQRLGSGQIQKFGSGRFLKFFELYSVTCQKLNEM